MRNTTRYQLIVFRLSEQARCVQALYRGLSALEILARGVHLQDSPDRVHISRGSGFKSYNQRIEKSPRETRREVVAPLASVAIDAISIE